MKFNYGRSMALCSLLFFGAVQANAGDCVLTVTRTACSKDAEKESFKKCDGKATCDENKKTGSEAACAKEVADFVERSQAISLNGSTRFHGSEPPNFIQRIHL